MKKTSLSLIAAAFVLSGCATQGQHTFPAQPDVNAAVRTAAPAMTAYTQKLTDGELWQRQQLSARDRSLVTLAALVTRDNTTLLPHYLNVALDNGVKPSEISELLTHLAFYAGWPNASSAAVVTSSVFASRGIRSEQLPGADVTLLHIDEAAEARRVKLASESLGNLAPGVEKYTTEALFRDLWLRPGLAPRDRSLITVSSLITEGQSAQLPYHLNRAMDSGLTKEQASETLTQLAFIAGWPKVFAALPVFKEVVTSRKGS
ncbi:carboxymuconolactone decarboxylase family protein [Pectobacterium jejuense]|uniref:carboxymuconolactone decarboxylase family protein n=1 Tax=Pectobacterium jejuense TaxID=2974022 RepID=UPI0032EB56F5